MTLPLDNYPRPQLRREKWTNLNGEWEYQIVKENEETNPRHWKPIIVPYALGTPLSQTCDTLQEGEVMWYRKSFAAYPSDNKTILHFEAIDQVAYIFLNGVEIASHIGGYTPFEIDISEHLRYQNSLMVLVKDMSDASIYMHGKQVRHPGNIFYRDFAGIWGTVWIEEVGRHYIQDVRLTPDIDHRQIHVELFGDYTQAKLTFSAKDGSYYHVGLTEDGTYSATIDNFIPWTCENPYLYDLEIETQDDKVTTYFAMRNVYRENVDGVSVFTLNHQKVFLTGVLDQGIHEASGYTFESDAKMYDELVKIKELGFNTIRKHVKVESRRWYYYCDMLGLLVIQDIPNTGVYNFVRHTLIPLIFNKTTSKKDEPLTPLHKEVFRMELDAIVQMLYNSPCVVIYTLFNEGWGQFDTEHLCEAMQTADPTRLIDATSGWYDKKCGDFLSVHTYFRRLSKAKADDRIWIISEFGGYVYQAEGKEKAFGYKHFKDRLCYARSLMKLYQDVLSLKKEGLCGIIYTQWKDTFQEKNGIYTNDMQLCKPDAKQLKKINEKLIDSQKT